MDFLTGMNKAIEYIEKNLDGSIKNDELARISLTSTGSFPRIFKYATGMTLTEYIRKRRLTEAASELQRDNVKIITLALKYGYDSESSFIRAFQHQHDASPKQVRAGASVKAYSPLHFSFSIRGDVALDYKITDMPSLRMVGQKTRIRRYEDYDGAEVTQLWKDSKELRETLAGFSTEEEQFVYGMSYYSSGDYLDYYITSISDVSIPSHNNESHTGYDRLEEIIVPSSKWAIFNCTGPLPETQVNTYRQIFTEWLPSTDYKAANIPEIEWYSPGDVFTDDYKSAIWIPIE